MRIVVTGGREFTDRSFVNASMDLLYRKYKITLLIEGGARGADRLARDWAERTDVPLRTYEADWDTYGSAAGPIRNQQMIDEGKPHGAVVFPGDRGTADMTERLEKAGIPMFVPSYKATGSMK